MSESHDWLYFPDNEGTVASSQAMPKPSKVTIVGVGAVGMACAYSILSQNLVKEVVLSDVDRDRLKGEVMDLQHAGNFLSAKITAASEDYHETAGSDICIISAGVRQRVGETRLELVERNVAVLKAIVPNLVKHSPNTILVVVSNPVDILAYVAWKLSGLPSHRVFGSGTYLDSSRFRVLLAEKLEINPQSVHGWIIGEHGDSSVPVWSGVNVAGVNVSQSGSTIIDQEHWSEIHSQVVQAAYQVIKLKGYTNWAIGSAIGSLVRTILKDERRVLPLGGLIKGYLGVNDEVFLSLPVVVGRSGIVRTIRLDLSEGEKAAFQKSASTIWEIQSKLNL